MSYNIDDCSIVEGSLTISSKTAYKLYKEYGDELPESNFLEDIADEFDGNDETVDVKMQWCGEGSGHCRDLLKTILEKTKGKASLLLIWEGGDSMSGLKVDNGVVKDGKVKIEVV